MQPDPTVLWASANPSEITRVDELLAARREEPKLNYTGWTPPTHDSAAWGAEPDCEHWLGDLTPWADNEPLCINASKGVVAMKQAIRITSDRIDSPDLNRVVACLLALALAELEAERADDAECPAEGDGDD